MKIEHSVSLGKEPPPETSIIKKLNWSIVSENDILDYSQEKNKWDYKGLEIFITHS